jgi:transcription antitermination factor NusG
MTWAVVQTEAQREHAVRLLLMRRQYETYFPRIKVRQRIVPLFPSYLFVRLISRQWYGVMWTPHVIRLLMAGDRPAQLSEDVVNEIRKREHNGLVKLPSRQFRKGQNVQITRGSFKGYIGLYEGISGKDRQRILLELLGQTVPVELSEKDIAPLQVASQHRQCY